MAKSGETDPNEHLDTQCHFVCYIEKDGDIWELDGRLDSPVNKGKMPTNEDGNPAHLGLEVSKIIQNYMALDQGETKFSVMALAPNYSDDFY